MSRGWRALLALLAGLLLAMGAAGARELREARISLAAPDAAPDWQPVTLPYHWDRQQRSRAGQARFEIAVDFEVPPAEPYGLYIPLVGNRAELRWNGALLARWGELDQPNRDDFSKAPRYVEVPVALLHERNLLEVRIAADGGRRAGLAAIALMPAREARGGLFSDAYPWRIVVSLLLAVFSLLVAFLALSCWLMQSHPGPDGRPRRDNLYLWAGVAELCWALRVGDAAIQQPPLDWPLWGVVMTASYAGWICGVLLFCHHVAGWREHASMRWLRWGCVALFAAAVAASWLSFARQQPLFLTAWLAAAIVVTLGYALVYLAITVRHPSTARWLMAGAGLLNIVIGVRDWVVIRLSDNLGVFTWNRYVSVAFGLALLYIVLLRFREASGQARELLATLAARVAQRERELAGTYGQLEQAAREQARIHERERILRDMHDGVGAHISAAIRQLQAGDASQPELLRTLRDSMDQLKLTIDSIHLPAGDVGALLAALRYRLEPRLQAAGIGLEWAVDELQPVPRLDAQAMRQLQFLLFEAISNVLQHAQARGLRIEAAMAGGTVRLAVIDNGRGFDAARVPRALRERAQAIGAVLALESRAGRTVVGLDIA